jgi:hypothetical protein
MPLPAGRERMPFDMNLNLFYSKGANIFEKDPTRYHLVQIHKLGWDALLFTLLVLGFSTSRSACLPL